MEIGTLCIKIAGRDAGKMGVIIDIIGKNFVLLEGQVRRRKCNIKHLELLPQKVEVSKNAQRAEVKAALKKLKLELVDTKPKPKTERPRKARKGKTEQPEKQEIPAEKKKKEEKPAPKKKMPKTPLKPVEKAKKPDAKAPAKKTTKKVKKKK